jgi:hypothetical protein
VLEEKLLSLPSKSTHHSVVVRVPQRSRELTYVKKIHDNKQYADINKNMFFIAKEVKLFSENVTE